MNNRDPDTERLNQALATLEPRPASPHFTARVLAALDETGRARHGATRVWALAAVASGAIALGIFLGTRPEPPLANLAAERESLKIEHGELVRELESLRSLARETRPVLYLGSGNDVDYVLDLSPLVAPQGPTVRPAGLAEENGPTRYY